MMTSACLIKEAVISNDDVSIADCKKSRISNYDVSISTGESFVLDSFQMSLVRRRFVCNSGSLYTLSFPGSDVSLGDEIWLKFRDPSGGTQTCVDDEPLYFPLRAIGSLPSLGQSVDPVPSGTSSSQPSVAPHSLSRQRFRPRGRCFKRSSSSSSNSGGSSGVRPNASFFGQCGGKHRPSQCIGVLGACNNCGLVGHFARVCPTLGQRDLTRSSSRRPYRSFQSQRSGFQPLETFNARELSLSEKSGLQPTQVDATTVE
ncbi:hypothetical protein F511_32587 [Dorcoceras hygrometricum]|uniref:CCHC-type domain-containing protein n=1 Tax=Dorcoceras hygrometricum TaxID=472368 RepID=A0A2Z7ACQ5_9LAMI|nr:hypothetical protein F511_32587 [Dorcoceras hygrometricum]